MLRSLLFAALCAGAACTDDGSALMQSAVGLSHTATAQEISTAIHNLGDDINAINIPGKARQMAINAMMRSVAGAEKLDDNAKEILNNITVLLANILDQMKLQKAADQAEIDGVLAAITSCNDEGVTEDGNLQATVEGSQSAHEACRTEEVALFDDDAAKCLILTDFLMQTGDVNCNKPQPTQDEIPAWDSLFTKGYNWFKTTKDGFEPKRDDCLASGAALAAKIEACGQLQNGYENHFCEWHLHRVERCAQLTACYDHAIEAHQNVTDRIRPLSEQRVREAGVIEHVNCLIKNLIDGVTDRTLCEDVIDEAANQLAYGNTYPDPLPSKDDCSTAAVDIHPGATGWYDFAYSGLDEKTPADDSTGIICNTDDHALRK